jgi:NAD(P) transhydrogenase subunit alpha
MWPPVPRSPTRRRLGAELVLKVRSPSTPTSCALMKPGSHLVGMLNPFDATGLQRLAGAG